MKQKNYYELPRLAGEPSRFQLSAWAEKVTPSKSRWVGHARINGRTVVWESRPQKRLPRHFIEWVTGGLTPARFNQSGSRAQELPNPRKPGETIKRKLGLEAARALIQDRLENPPRKLKAVTRSVVDVVVLVPFKNSLKFLDARGKRVAEIRESASVS